MSTDAEGDQQQNGFAEEEEINLGKTVSPDDGRIALGILIVSFVIVAIFVYFTFAKKKPDSSDNWDREEFTPPKEREEYLQLKEKLDPNNEAKDLNVKDLDELKKALMRRAMKTIPILLSLQSEGSSIERLYKKGILTDDMHFKVKEIKDYADKEFAEVQLEADALVEGWGTGGPTTGGSIWQQAMKFHSVIEAQAKNKEDLQKQAEENKKKEAKQKQKEKEKAKKKKKGETGTESPQKQNVSASPVIEEISPEERKARDAERMAEQLIKEEEAAAAKSHKGGKKKQVL